MFRLIALDVASFPCQTRMPFRFGIAELTAMPHVFVRATIDVGNGKTVQGVAGDGLVPKWFEKDPVAGVQSDLDRLWEVVQAAGTRALEYGEFDQPFHLWYDLYQEQIAWGNGTGFPPLLSHFGLTLVERAVIDAVCRFRSATLSQLLAAGTIVVDVNRISDPPTDRSMRDVLAAKPLESLTARHTVGMADPLTRSEVAEPIGDGLPESLEEDIEQYGLSHFKIKVCGDVTNDIERLSAISAILNDKTTAGFRFTLDGNEQFVDVGRFQSFWGQVRSSPRLSSFFTRLIFVEQPFKREYALSNAVGNVLRSWTDAPPIIIDESDGSLASLPDALSRGYRGTSHKNCKGVFKGLINAARVSDRVEAAPEAGYVMSAEDLVNIGPIALLQDLAVVAKLGIPHVERNGHHYFKGLSMFPEALQTTTAAAHGDLYRIGQEGYAELRINAGMLSTGSINRAPFGLDFLPEGDFVPLSDWKRPRAPQS